MKVTSIQNTREVEALIRTHQGAIRGYLVFLGCPSDLVDDLVQDAFLSVLSSRFEHRSDPKTGAYLRKVARHLFLKLMERERRHLPLAELPLAELNRARYQAWQRPFSTDNATPALFTFTGDVYDGLAASTLARGDVRYAQNHIRILSGLYGLLRPLDLMQPYRLEMGRPLATRGAPTLYAFWRTTVTAELNRARGDTVVNLASQEYFKVVDAKRLDKTIVTPQFKDEKNGDYKIISFFAKRARGAMARTIVQERISDAAGLVSFCADGYRYCPDRSQPHGPVFIRPARH